MTLARKPCFHYWCCHHHLAAAPPMAVSIRILFQHPACEALHFCSHRQFERQVGWPYFQDWVCCIETEAVKAGRIGGVFWCGIDGACWERVVQSAHIGTNDEGHPKLQNKHRMGVHKAPVMWVRYHTCAIRRHCHVKIKTQLCKWFFTQVVQFRIWHRELRLGGNIFVLDDYLFGIHGADSHCSEVDGGLHVDNRHDLQSSPYDTGKLCPWILIC